MLSDWFQTADWSSLTGALAAPRLLRISWLVLAAGGLLLVWALRGRRTNIPTCHRCRYNLTGLPETVRCPECGWRARSARDRFRRVRKRGLVWLSVFAVLAGLVVPGYFAYSGVQRYGWRYFTYVPPLYTLWPTIVYHTEQAGDYEIEYHVDRRPVWPRISSAPERIRIRRAGRTLYDHWISGANTVRVSLSSRSPLEDFTRDGYPDLAIHEAWGRTESRLTLLTFDGLHVRPIAVFFNAKCTFIDVHPLDGAWEILHESNGEQANYRFDGSDYVLAGDLRFSSWAEPRDLFSPAPWPALDFVIQHLIEPSQRARLIRRCWRR